MSLISLSRLIRVIKNSQDYTDALAYISTKKYGGPKNVSDMKNLLRPFLNSAAGEYFTDDRWTRDPMTCDLALIFLISEAEEHSRGAFARPSRKARPLEKAIMDLRVICLDARSAFLRSKEADENRKARVPKSLSYQKTGLRIQDSFQFNIRKADVDPCPHPDCNHHSTMAVESQKVVNAKNAKRRKDALDGNRI